jgi:polyphosphate kinase
MAEPIQITKGKVSKPNLGHRTYYFNRELSWLEFNRRVLAEALDESKPLLERVKFTSIFSSNLDEFFMVRVSGLRRQLAAGSVGPPADGMTPVEQLAAIREDVMVMLDQLATCWEDQLEPALEEQGIRILAWDELKSVQRKTMREHFKTEISPALTPLAFDPGHPFPHISNLSVNLAIEIEDPHHGVRFARVKVPHLFDRLLPLPAKGRTARQQNLGLGGAESVDYVWLEEVVAANVDLLFPGIDIVGVHPFRITRDADFEIEEDEAADLMESMQEIVDRRQFGNALRLEVGTEMPARIRKILIRNIDVAPYQVYESRVALGLSDLMQLMKTDRPELKDPVFETAFFRCCANVTFWSTTPTTASTRSSTLFRAPPETLTLSPSRSRFTGPDRTRRWLPR